MKFALLMPLLVVGLISGCSTNSKPRPPEFKESLVTDTRADGVRFFTYEVSMAAPYGRGVVSANGPLRGRESNGCDQPSGCLRDQSHYLMEDLAIEKLFERMDENGFCPHGWFIVRREHKPQTIRFLGECQSNP